MLNARFEAVFGWHRDEIVELQRAHRSMMDREQQIVELQEELKKVAQPEKEKPARGGSEGRREDRP